LTDLTITGTGVPLVEPGRVGAGVLVRHGNIALQSDAGRATTLRIAEAGQSIDDLTALFITHHLSDHLTGLQDLLFVRWLQNHDAFVPLPVFAPEGPAIKYLELMMDPWAEDIAIRHSHASREDRPDPDIQAFPAPEGPTVIWSHDGDDGAITVTVTPVHHEPVSPSVAYRVDTPDGAVVISGDTRVCDEVAELSKGANVLVHEIFRTEFIRPFMAVAPHLEHIADCHADSGELGAMAGRVDVPTLMLTHMIPAPINEAEELEMAAEVRANGYNGEIVVARDLTTVSF